MRATLVSVPLIAFLAVFLRSSAADFPKAPDNAALQYWQAFSFLSSDADTLRSAKPTNEGLSWTAQLLSQNTNAVQYLHRGAAMSSVNWGLAYDQGIFCPVPHLEKAKHLAQAGLLWGRQAVFDKRFDDALQTTADVIALARHVAADPMLTTMHVACEIQADAVQQLAEQLPAIPKDALAKFSDRLRSLPPMPSMEAALRMDQQMIRLMPVREAASQPALVPRPELYDEVIGIIVLPPDQWPAAEVALIEKTRARGKMVLSSFPPRTFKIIHTIARSNVQFALLEAAVAVTRDGADAAGRFNDPYFKKPIKYRASDGGFELISEVVLDGKPVSLRVGREKSEAGATGEIDQAALAARAFRTQATVPFGAATTRLYLSASDEIDTKARAELLRILDEYDRKVDAAADEVRKHPPEMHTLTDPAGKMGMDFEDVLEKWMVEHPDVKSAIDDMEAELAGLIDTLINEREQIVVAATRAGVKREDARKIVEEAHKDFLASADRIEKRRQDDGRAPEGDPRRLNGMTILSDWEMEKLRITKTMREKFRELLPADRRKKLDEELAKLREGR